MLDIHVHPRRGAVSAVAHLDGSGVAKAVLLARIDDQERVKTEISGHPGRLVWFGSTDPSKPGGIDRLRQAIAGGGALGFGEMKTHLAAASPDMQRLYDLAAEMRVPVLLHFQEVQHFATEGNFNEGFHDFDKMLKAHRNTTFIAHADLFWANVSADVPPNVAYPDGPIKPGGLSDRWLSDYPNFYGDLSANSGNNAISRDRDFMRGFFERHQTKLMFGSDCSCRDGHGAGGNPILPRLKGKCVARDTLGLLKSLTTPDVFRRITWENGTRLLKISA